MTTSKEAVKASSLSLNGLRGLASIHVALYHLISMCGLGGQYKIFINGALEMPFFFLMSGFALALAYGKREGNLCREWRELLRYFMNRLSRIVPTYYLVLICSRLFNNVDLLNLITVSPGQVAMNLLCVNSWAYPLCAFFSIGCYQPFLIVTWTIHTLVFFYLVFPPIFTLFQKLSNTTLLNLLVLCFYIQLVPWFCLAHMDSWTFSMEPNNLYWTVAASPESRLPVFCMGILAGILQNRASLNTDDFQTLELDRFFLLDLFPLPKVSCTKASPSLPNKLCCLNNKKDSIRRWRIKVDVYSLLLNISFIAGAVVYHLNNLDRRFEYWGQLVLPHLQLMIIVGLYNDQGSSFLARFCALKPIQLLGNVSMPIYLLHPEVKRAVINKVKLEWLDPILQILLSMVTTVAVSWVITVFFETPIRSLTHGKSLASIGRELTTKNPWAIPKLILIIFALALFYYKLSL